MLWYFAGCAASTPLEEECDPRELQSGEVRAKRIACEDELIPGGEGRVGDWLIENAAARFVVRGVYASLTEWGEEGGTLVDAAAVGAPDLLDELIVDADRSSIEVVSQQSAAELRLPGLVYHLAPDQAYLALATPSGGPVDGRWVPRPGADRFGAVARGDRVFGGGEFATDGAVDAAQSSADEGHVDLVSLGRVSVSVERAFPGASVEEYADVDADFIGVEVAGSRVDLVLVQEGAAAVVVPPGATVSGVRDGCVYTGITKAACASLAIQVTDEAGVALPATVHFEGRDFALPAGGGFAPLGPTSGSAWLWAGPAYSAVKVDFAGINDELAVVLSRVLDPERAWPPEGENGARFPTGGLVLAAMDAEVAPGNGTFSADLLHELRSQGVGFAVLRADAEIPVVQRDVHDDLHAVSATGAPGIGWSWSWSGTTARPAHGAPDVEGFDVLDQLALLRGGNATDRFTVVTPSWMETALGLSEPFDWSPQPDALMLSSLADLPALDTLLNAWIPVVPVGPRTWLAYAGADNTTAFEAAVRQGRSSAGNGPRIALSEVDAPGSRVLPGTVRASVQAPGWMGLRTVELHTDHGVRSAELTEAGDLTFCAPLAHWAYAVVQGESAQPWGGEAAWAVSSVVWLRGPVGG